MNKTLTHSLNCPARTPTEADDCHCGLKYRIEAQDYLTLLTAWQQRCIDSEKQLSAIKQREAMLVEALVNAAIPLNGLCMDSHSETAKKEVANAISCINSALSNSTEHTEKYMAEVKEEAYQRGRADEAYDRN